MSAGVPVAASAAAIGKDNWLHNSCLEAGVYETDADFDQPIETVSLDSRVPTLNPDPSEYDFSLSEPAQDWLRVRIEARRSDGADLEIELLRPLDWLQETGLDRVGMPFDVTYDDLGVRAIGLVTEIGPCGDIAPGDGQVVIGRFITRDATRLTRVVFADPENTAETAELVGTPIHRIWSHDRQEWVPLAQLVAGEQVLGETGPVLVALVESRARQAAVYNLETHGEHVYQVTQLGVVVHNANKNCALGGKAADDLAGDAGKVAPQPNAVKGDSRQLGRKLEADGHGARPKGGYQAAHIVPSSSFVSRSPKIIDAIASAQAKFNKYLGADLRNSSINGFWGQAGHAGTHTDKYFLALGEEFANVGSQAQALKALSNMWARIKGGEFQ